MKSICHLHHHLSFIGFIIASVMTKCTSHALTLLSDLPTPSFIIDTDALRRRVGPPISSDAPKSIFAHPIRCPENELVLRPSMIQKENTSNGDQSTIIDCDFEFIEGQPAIGYLHSSVVRAREDAIPGEDDPLSTFLAEIDLDPKLCCGDAQLVLGLNNHHVGGYYWARSAGAGSSMDCIGVAFCPASSVSKDDSETKMGLLRWNSEEGPIACNSNDGKRSEWVNFLRKDDTVQLVPANGQGALLQFTKHFGKQSAGVENSIRVFGISTQGRPMGSEPAVVCEWMIE